MQEPCPTCGSSLDGPTCQWCGELQQLVNQAFVSGELPLQLRATVDIANLIRAAQRATAAKEEEAMRTKRTKRISMKMKLARRPSPRSAQAGICSQNAAVKAGSDRSQAKEVDLGTRLTSSEPLI
jgi:hypothetical protein